MKNNTETLSVGLKTGTNKNTNPTFRFTQETLDKFDSIFPYEGWLQEGLWVYENPFKGYPVETPQRYKNEKFFVQVGFGGVQYIDGWNPNGMTIDQIIDKLKN
jgi:hypothetical protein